MNAHTDIKPMVARADWCNSRTGCIRTDIQTEWLATCQGQERKFYTDPFHTPEDARRRAITIWTVARAYPTQVEIVKLRDPLADYEGYQDARPAESYSVAGMGA